MKPIKKINLLFLAFVFAAAACTTVPITGRSQFNIVPDQTMLATSFQQYDQFLKENELSTDHEKTRMVKEVGQRIAVAVEQYLKENSMADEIRNYAWEFNLIEDEQINAWCMPGGKVVVYTGILSVAQDKAGLAVVMGHEIAHAVAKHGNERMSQALAVQLGGMGLSAALSSYPQQTQQLWMATVGAGAQIGILLPYSRLHEREADELGLIFMAMAGYDPNHAVGFWQRMSQEKSGGAPPEFLSTHPSDASRIQNIKELIPEAMQYYRQAR
ncbi:MAG: M48 family metallopeptidase [Desulfobacterales bacterium]